MLTATNLILLLFTTHTTAPSPCLESQVLATTLLAVWVLHAARHDMEAAALLLLGGAALASEWLGLWRAGVGTPVAARQGIVGGAHLGLLTLPW